MKKYETGYFNSLIEELEKAIDKFQLQDTEFNKFNRKQIEFLISNMKKSITIPCFQCSNTSIRIDRLKNHLIEECPSFDCLNCKNIYKNYQANHKEKSKCNYKFDEGLSEVRSLLLINNEYLISGHEKAELNLWHIHSRKLLHRDLTSHKYEIYSLIKYNENTFLSICNEIDGVMNVFYVSNHKFSRIRTYEVMYAKYSNLLENNLVLGKLRKGIDLWRIDQSDTNENYNIDLNLCDSLSNDQDTKLISSVLLTSNFIIYGTSTGLIKGTKRNGDKVSQGDCIIYDKVCDKQIHALYSINDNIFASGDFDFNAHIWSTSQQKPLMKIAEFKNIVTCFNYSKANEILFVGSCDENMYMFYLDNFKEYTSIDQIELGMICDGIEIYQKDEFKKIRYYIYSLDSNIISQY